MTMTIRLMDGEEVVDTCEIAAYVGGECRGAVRAHTDSLYYLVIAGDGAGQPMELRTVINGEEIVLDKLPLPSSPTTISARRGSRM